MGKKIDHAIKQESHEIELVKKNEQLKFKNKIKQKIPIFLKTSLYNPLTLLSLVKCKISNGKKLNIHLLKTTFLEL